MCNLSLIIMPYNIDTLAIFLFISAKKKKNTLYFLANTFQTKATTTEKKLIKIIILIININLILF